MAASKVMNEKLGPGERDSIVCLTALFLGVVHTVDMYMLLPAGHAVIGFGDRVHGALRLDAWSKTKPPPFRWRP